MAGTARMSSLPMIKCSSCNTDIEISQLADHVCAPSSKTTEFKPPKLDRAATFGAPLTQSRTNPERSGRMPPPPMINPSAANKPFRPQNQYPPSPMSSYHGSKSPGLLSPTRGRPKMQRSATSPMQAPPSPDLTSNLDCAFPPFPTSASSTPKRGKSVPRDKLEPRPSFKYPGPNPLYAPLSPSLNAGQNISKRMDTIAPGPFDGRRPSTSEGRDMPSQIPPQKEDVAPKRATTRSSTKSSTMSHNERMSFASTASRSSTFSSRSAGLPAHPKARMVAAGTPPPPPLPKMEPENEGIDALLSRLQSETMQPSKITQDRRSKSFPLRQESKDEIEPPKEPPKRPRRPSETSVLSTRLAEARLLESFPAPGPTYQTRPLRGRDDELHLGDALSPTLSYGTTLPSNPLHTPSDSGRSEDSISSGGSRSAASSRSSPATSEASGQHSRDVSKISRPDHAAEEPIPRVESPESFMDPRTPPQPKRSQKPTGFDRGQASGSPIQPPFSPLSNVPESPMDPAIQHGIFYQMRMNGPQPPKEAIRAENILKPSGASPLQPPQPPKEATRAENILKPSSVSPPRAPEPVIRPRTSKGKCGGCSEPIIGKSIKDSSGRLTGRYHKQCFVCKTCHSPFPSAEFYVFENGPYCEQHYHELNGSLCTACNRGIEGQYLEMDQRRKFHPRCFHCFTCRIILRDDYYEVAGKPYCERHAYVAQKNMHSLAPGNNRFLGTNNLQKRRTRLMMM